MPGTWARTRVWPRRFAPSLTNSPPEPEGLQPVERVPPRARAKPARPPSRSRAPRGEGTDGGEFQGSGYQERGDKGVAEIDWDTALARARLQQKVVQLARSWHRIRRGHKPEAT